MDVRWYILCAHVHVVSRRHADLMSVVVQISSHLPCLVCSPYVVGNGPSLPPNVLVERGAILNNCAATNSMLNKDKTLPSICGGWCLRSVTSLNIADRSIGSLLPYSPILLNSYCNRHYHAHPRLGTLVRFDMINHHSQNTFSALRQRTPYHKSRSHLTPRPGVLSAREAHQPAHTGRATKH
jgi:hypothetical protein